MAITLHDGKPPPGSNALALLKLPLVLVVEKSSKIKSAGELWERDRIEETLVSLPTNESIYKYFQQGLGRLKVDWFTGIEVGTVELVELYVPNSYGYAFSMA